MGLGTLAGGVSRQESSDASVAAGSVHSPSGDDWLGARGFRFGNELGPYSRGQALRPLFTGALSEQDRGRGVAVGLERAQNMFGTLGFHS
jgi:hypothetical protein